MGVELLRGAIEGPGSQLFEWKRNLARLVHKGKPEGLGGPS